MCQGRVGQDISKYFFTEKSDQAQGGGGVTTPDGVQEMTEFGIPHWGLADKVVTGQKLG